MTVIHPSRSRPEKSHNTLVQWASNCTSVPFPNFIVSLDSSDPTVEQYKKTYQKNTICSAWMDIIVNDNRSCVDAINNAAKFSDDDILIVVSDDTGCFKGWDTALLKELEGKKDYLLKCKDGIQDYIVTMTVMDRQYYERDGYIYHPDFFHQFADTYLTCKADIRGRLIKSNLKFPHNHYSHVKETPDELHKRNDATWREGQNTFVRLMKEFTPEERARIKDKSMQGFMKHVGL